MIVENEVNVLAELVNKTDKGILSYKHHTARTLVQLKQWCLHDYFIYTRQWR